MNQRAYKGDYGTYLKKLQQVKDLQMEMLLPSPNKSKESDLVSLQTELYHLQSQLYKKLLLEEFTPEMILSQEETANTEIDKINENIENNKLLGYPNEPCVQERLEKLKEEIKYIQLKKAVVNSGLNDDQQRSILNYLSMTSLPQYVTENDLARDNMYAKKYHLYKGGKKSRHKKGKKNKKCKTKKH